MSQFTSVNDVNWDAIENCKPSFLVQCCLDPDRVLICRLLRILLLVPEISNKLSLNYFFSLSLVFPLIRATLNKNKSYNTCGSFNAEVSINLANFSSSAIRFPVWNETKSLFSYASFASSRRSLCVPTMFSENPNLFYYEKFILYLIFSCN